MAGGIRFGHSHAAVLDSGLQLILHGGGIGSQRGGQLVVEHIAGEVVDTALSLVSVCAGQTDGRQYGIRAFRAIETIQHTHLTLTIHQFVVHGDVSNTEVGELHALNGILAQLVGNRTVMQASRNIGLSVPRAVFAGRGDVVFIDAQRCLLAGIDDRRRICCGKCRGHQPKGHKRHQQQCQYAMDLFHVQLFSLFIIFELSFSLFTGILVVSIRRR